ncbi:MAG TPA: energy transducer TonB [Vicinamibacterales bacterium]|jgi:TonB family protein
MDCYSPAEIAMAAGVSETAVRAELGSAASDRFVTHREALQIGIRLAEQAQVPGRFAPSLFANVGRRHGERHPVAMAAVSFGLHGCLAVAFVLIASLSLAPRAAAFRVDEPVDPMRLVFLSIPGPGGGGGGGGLLQRVPPPKALREGTHRLNSPLPERTKPDPVPPPPTEPPPPPPLQAERFPVLVAPVVVSPADRQERAGVLEQTNAQVDSHGPGQGGGAGTGRGAGIGEGSGPGIGPGSGGGTGGGPYRPGSGISPPRLLKEVKADYTEEARQRSISGNVVLEIVVRRDGSVGDVKVLQGLPSGLNDRAIAAVRQWRFSPAERQGTPVDVVVEVSVEFRLR